MFYEARNKKLTSSIHSEALALFIQARFDQFYNEYTTLNKKQFNILIDLLGPLNNNEIAQKHRISTDSLRYHLKKIYKKTDTGTREKLNHEIFPEIFKVVKRRQWNIK